MKRLREEGYTCQIVEHWNAFAGRRIDLFGCIDVVAVIAGTSGVLGVQATSATNVSARLKKAEASEAIRVWLAAGNQFQIWGWSLRQKDKGVRGARKTWQATIREIGAVELGLAMLARPRTDMASQGSVGPARVVAAALDLAAKAGLAIP